MDVKQINQETHTTNFTEISQCLPMLLAKSLMEHSANICVHSIHTSCCICNGNLKQTCDRDCHSIQGYREWGWGWRQETRDDSNTDPWSHRRKTLNIHSTPWQWHCWHQCSPRTMTRMQAVTVHHWTHTRMVHCKESNSWREYKNLSGYILGNFIFPQGSVSEWVSE